MVKFRHTANTIPECIIVVVTIRQHNFVPVLGNLLYSQELLKIIRIHNLFIKWLLEV